MDPTARSPDRSKPLAARDVAMTSTSARSKWGTAIDAGFQIIPNVLIRAQRHLDLDATDIVILLNICMHWWSVQELPYPRPEIIARRIGVTRRTVERRLAQLEDEGLIARLPPEKSPTALTIRRFDMSGLVQRLEELTLVDLQRRKSA